MLRFESYTHDYSISGVTKTRPARNKAAARASCVLQLLLRWFITPKVDLNGGFGGLEVSVLAFGTGVRGFKPGRSRRIFRAKKSSARLPSEGK